jgi:hypothetical protein
MCQEDAEQVKVCETKVSSLREATLRDAIQVANGKKNVPGSPINNSGIHVRSAAAAAARA